MDVKILEQLASRICHDLVSPVGAVNNGIEFLEDMGPEALDDALSLIKYSAGQASAKLQAFRYIYGAGGSDPQIKPESIYQAFENFISGDGKTTQNWDPHEPLGQAGNPPGFCKLLMGSLLMAYEFLPKGGVISVTPGITGQTIVSAEGPDVSIKPGVTKALEGDITEELDTKLVHPLVLCMIAQNYNFTIQADISETGMIRIMRDWDRTNQITR